MDTKNLNQKIKFCIVIFVIIIAMAIMFFLTLRYEVEGEKNVPFKIEKIIVISSAKTDSVDEKNVDNTENNRQENNTEQPASETSQNNNEQQLAEQSLENNNEQQSIDTTQTENSQQPVEEKYIWNEKVIQTNDLFIYLNKTEDYKTDEIIKSVRIENINILKNVKIGKIQVYMPNSLDDGLYKYTNDFLVNSSLQYKGALQDNTKTLEIANNGGCFCISFANMGLDTYKSNDDTEIAQGAYILGKMNIPEEDLKFKVSFDFVIEVGKKQYKTNVVVDLPVDNLVGNKESHTEINDLDNLVYKRF